MRRHFGPPGASMITEYQASFLPPSCYKSVISSFTQKNPYHPLKGANADISTFRAFYFTPNRIKPPSKPPGPREDHISTRTPAVTNTDYTTVYRNDFRDWKAEKCQSLKQKSILKVNHGFKEDPKYVAEDKESVPKNSEQKPFEGTSCYRLDYVPYQVQPRQSRWMPANQTNKGLPAVSSRPKPTHPQNQELLNGPSEFFDQFGHKGPALNLQSNPSAEHKFQSTTHADITAPKCPVTKSVLLSTQNSEKTLEPFQVMVNMESCSAWDGPRRFTRS
ncbi:uncharacterized protein LOC121640619 [Melanotaenia boesemani]|uniref:uncharacterized protein LOC121640619 n=1 Tax=Melanotaenia boesemani TaxID=1250792 RepID=UPI001C047D2F|nr:uncharacterized protein LOC121640619 [Melanotaenia boesemani]